MRLRAPLALLLLLPACGNPWTNTLFYEDAEFLAALPSFDNHGVSFPEVQGLDGGEPDEEDLRTQSAAVADMVNATLADLMTLGDYVRSDEPSLREDDLRSWGPMSLENGSRSLLLVDIVRSGVGQYDWAFQLSESSGGPWEAFYQGTHYPGSTVADGDGRFEADIGLLASHLGEEREGVASCEYDLREGTYLGIDLRGYREHADEDALSAHYVYDEQTSGEADFQYGIEADLVEGGEPERVGVRTRWRASGDMRADSRMYGGEVGENEYTLSQCWDAEGALVYQADSWNLMDPVGASGDCSYEKPYWAEDW